ncbi:helix-turn-helix domain-containing protein [Nonomuraea lactucae]|uniref:helix-turn-helix domain-containing protein n=1 Tax=Nonomuraea lactucae TaxID=2249762 RepID=UPI001963FEB4|nr:helix-turn-helix domain-containing protein [Nonomuraea lactucae]
MNERLRTAMLRHGVAMEDLAEVCGVEPKTVERWINTGRVPHRRHRWAAAKKLSADETYLWPDVLESSQPQKSRASRSELVEVFPDRASVPRELWLRLMVEAQERLDVLVMLAAAAERGVSVRLCFGDPAAQAVEIRDREEGLGGTLAAKIRSSLTYYKALPDLDNCEIRLHAITLYASLFRYDDDILANPHAYGEPASANPTFHFRRLDGGVIADHYMTSFERVWAEAQPWSGTGMRHSHRGRGGPHPSATQTRYGTVGVAHGKDGDRRDTLTVRRS